MDADFHGLLSRVQTLPDAPETCPAVKPGERCRHGWHELASGVKPCPMERYRSERKRLAQLVTDFTDPGELICDPYAGGGTMAVACQELGRDCITFECDEETYNKAQHRIKEAGKQQPLFTPKAAQATQLQLG